MRLTESERTFPRWSGEQHFCRNGHGKMRGKREPIPFFAAVGPLHTHLKRWIYRCKRCPWCEIGQSDYMPPSQELRLKHGRYMETFR